MKSRNLVVFFSMLVMIALALSACGSVATPAPTAGARCYCSHACRNFSACCDRGYARRDYGAKWL